MSNPRVYVRYGGSCSSCDKLVQATPILTTGSKSTKVWVRCEDCGQITLCEQTATEAASRLDGNSDE